MNQIHQKHHAKIAQFLTDTQECDSDLDQTVKSIIVQFLSSLGQKLRQLESNPGNGIVSGETLIEFQIEALRECIIDLCTVKQSLQEGITRQ